MQFSLYWAIAIFIIAGNHFMHLNAIDITTLSSFVSPKTISCYKCSTLTSSACKDISQADNHEHLIEECGPKAKGCVKQVAEKSDGTKYTFRECYYAKISTFLFFTNLVCENIPRTSSYVNDICYKCSGSLCNSGNRLDSTFSSWLNLAILPAIVVILRM